ncbi:MAG: hypothetical protein K2O81_02195, partial [Clostridia bacterium]|nr:hypothetical protein [Clostridia bacterium]
CIELRGDAVEVTIVSGGTLTLTVSSTGSSNWSSIAIKNASGEYMPATYNASSNIMASGNVYGVKTSGTQSTLSFNLSEGTYTICTLETVGETATARNTRLYALSIEENYKLQHDVTVTWGSEKVTYHHTDKVTAPNPTGLSDTEKFEYWYYMDGDNEVKWTDGSTLAAGSYSFIAKTSTVVAVESVEVSASAETVEIGGSVTLTATAKDGDGNVLDGRTATWDLGGYEYAEVSVDGVLTVLAGAKVDDTITVTATIGTKTATVTLTVTPASKVNLIDSITETGNIGKNTNILGSNEKIEVSIDNSSSKIALTSSVTVDGETYENAFISNSNGTKVFTFKAKEALKVTVYYCTTNNGAIYTGVPTTSGTQQTTSNANVYKVEAELAANGTLTISGVSGCRVALLAIYVA